MKINCPNCGVKLAVSEKLHYEMIKCPKCGHEFQVFGSETIRLSREFLDNLKKIKPQDPPKE
ncbi:MAG: hypothetical protein ABIH42_04085 [Planctomycetota bacterium]